MRREIFAALAMTATALAGPGFAAAKDELLATDRAFAAMSAQQGNHAAFLAYMTDDGRLYRGGHPPILGKTAAAQFFADEERADPAYKEQKLVWTPLEAEASPDGALGYTRGTWTFAAPQAEGAGVILTGYYVTAWRRQADGTYKFCLDIGGADKQAQH